MKKKIKLQQFEKGPIRHESLTESLMVRIGEVATVFAEVDGRPVGEWVEDFRRDLHPEWEMIIWEGMAAAYTLFTKKQRLGLAAKKEVFGLLLFRSMNPQGSLNDVPLQRLSRVEAKSLWRTYDELARAEPGSA
jgi:hypothetical protein